MPEITQEQLDEFQRLKAAEAERNARQEADRVWNKKNEALMAKGLCLFMCPAIGYSFGGLIGPTAGMVGAIVMPLLYIWVLVREWKKRKATNPEFRWYDL